MSVLTLRNFKNILSLNICNLQQRSDCKFRFKILDIPKFYILVFYTEQFTFEDRIYKDNLKDIFKNGLQYEFLANVVDSVDRRINKGESGNGK